MYRPIQSLLSTGLVQCQVIPNDRYRKAYEIPDVEFKPLVGGMKFRDTKHGDGATVENGDIVNVQFTGRLLGGREVEATTNLSGGVMTITAGGSDVVRAVSEGVIGMREYGTRELLVPPTMHYPARFPGQIMIYDVMVRTVVRKHAQSESPSNSQSPQRQGLLSYFRRS